MQAQEPRVSVVECGAQRRFGFAPRVAAVTEQHASAHPTSQSAAARTQSMTLARSPAAFSMIELLVVLAVVFVIAILLVPSWIRAGEKARRISCVSHLKNVGLGFRIFSGDHTNLFPMALSTNFGGTKEMTASTDFFRHWQVMSNGLGVALMISCPADIRRPASDFTTLANSNISYFIGLEADETNPQMPLAGDRNVTNSRPVLNGVLTVTTNDNVGWTHELHGGVGNLALSDGSVPQFTTGRLREAFRNSGATNGVLRLAMPE
jgi:competence protein ComGC